MGELNEYTPRGTEKRGSVPSSIAEEDLITNEVRKSGSTYGFFDDDFDDDLDNDPILNDLADYDRELSDEEKKLIANSKDNPSDVNKTPKVSNTDSTYGFFDDDFDDDLDNDPILDDLADYDRELSDEEKKLIANSKDNPSDVNGTPKGTDTDFTGTQQGSDEKGAKKDDKDSLINSFFDLMRDTFGWDRGAQSTDADDALKTMIKNGDILDKYGDKLVGDTPEERKKALEKRLKNGEILYVYQKGEKYPRQLTYDEKTKEFGISEPVDKLELEKVPKPHWFVRFYLNLFSLMYRGRSLDAVRDWVHYEHQKEALAKAKSRKQIDRRMRRDPTLKEKKKEEEKVEEKKTEEEVKEKTQEEPKEIIRHAGPQRTEEIRSAGPQYTNTVVNQTQTSEIRHAGPQRTEEIRNAGPQYTDTLENPIVTPPQFEGENVEKPDQQPEEKANEELEQPVADGIDAVANTKDNLKDLTHVDEPVKPYEPKGMNVVQEPAQREREEQQKEKQSEPIEENKVPKETEKEKREAERKPMRDLGGKEGAKEGADKKSPDGSITEADNFIRESNQRLLDGKLSAAMEKNIRTLYENAESAKKQLSIACAKGEKFAGGDSIAHLVAFNNVKNQIESGRLSYTTRQLLSSENGSKMMYDGVMCAGEVKYAAKAKHVPEFFKDYFLEQEHLDAITEKADDKMEKFLGEQCGDNLHSALANLDRQQRNRQSIREQQRDRQLTSNQSMGLGGP